MGNVEIHLIQRLLGGEGEVVGRNGERRTLRGGVAVMPILKNKYPTRRNPKPLEQEAAQLFHNVPTWDPVKMRLSTDSLARSQVNPRKLLEVFRYRSA